MKLLSLVTIAAAACLTTACNQSNSQTDTVAQQKSKALAEQLCAVDQNFDVSHCQNGNRFFFQPSRFGNEQLPIMVIATFCDIHQPVYFNNGGVVCIFKDEESSS